MHVARYEVWFSHADTGVVTIEAETKEQAIDRAARTITDWDIVHRDATYDAREMEVSDDNAAASS